MRLKVFIFKKGYFICIFLIMLSLLTILWPKFNKTSTTFVSLNDSQSIKEDFNGDGKKDILYTKTSKNKYYLQVNTENETYFLKPLKKINTLGEFYPHWPLRATIMSISKDKPPSVFTQCSQNNLPIQHVFYWDEHKFKDIYCSNNNIIGFLDNGNKKAPKFLSGNIKDGEITMCYNILFNNVLNQFNYDTSNFPGGDSILGLIHYIENLTEVDSSNLDIFYSGLMSKNMSSLNQLSVDGTNFKFLDGFFTDTSWDNDNRPLEIKWNINFSYILKSKPNSKLQYCLSIILKPCEAYNNEFKIYSISILNN
ncbi:hypothetical protein [Clostridium algidicarnis]|uniref:VCBS repeat protein n=1 Tax=Clostridium algidicarnis DSM 15099 TaxID=1121295 RepID=A0A2S6FWF5_9CLOT|nr:hypothetical protein [Clostridium algidicarnis]PPK47867.1 hypothetical protein BD821_1128 [Clostridium algidicarnis DSM 15099]